MDFMVQMAKDVGQTVDATLAKAKLHHAILEPKYDGWRCVVIRTAEGVNVYKPSRSKSVAAKKYNGKLPELEADLMKLPVGTIFDGELVAIEFDGERYVNDFFRIHTVMRSNETRAEQRDGIKFVAFDAPVGQIAIEPLRVRRDYIRTLIDRCGLDMVELTTQLDATQENHDALVALGFEGTVLKDVTKPYAFGKRGHGWFKIKDVRTIDCVVMEVIQDGKGQHEGKAGKMVVGQYLDGVLTRVCKVNCLNNAQRDRATTHPQEFVGQVIEVKIYGWDTDGPRHPTPLRFRDGDKDPKECVWSKV